MTAYEYMKKQRVKHEVNLHRCIKKNAPEYEIQNVKNKIAYYEEACIALGGKDDTGKM
jgi:hypothetical protein